MKNLFEKIKSLDKKILIGAGAGIAALIIAVVLILVFALGGKDTEADKQDDKIKVEQNDNKDKDENKDKEEEPDEREEVTFTVKVVDGEDKPLAGVEVKLTSDTELTGTSDDAGLVVFEVEITEGFKLSVVKCPEGYEYKGEEIALEVGATEATVKVQKIAVQENPGQVQTEKPEAVNGVEQSTITTKPDGEEIFGQGTASEPYEEIPDLDTMTLTTVSIPAGKTLYYNIQRVGNMILTINDANAYVIESDGTRHDASGGIVTFTVEDAMASDYVSFQIGNKGGSAKAFTIKFSNPTGSQMNPTAATMGSNITINLAAGDSDGHWYKYVATQSGTIRFYLLSSADNNVLIVTNNRNSAQRTAEADGVADANGTYIDLEVQQGDEIIIQVGAKPNNRGKYPATTITWKGNFI